MKAPICYESGFVDDPASLFAELWSSLAWERRGLTPRREYYCNDVAVPYVYGRGAGVREYSPSAWTPALLAVKSAVEALVGAPREVCLLKGYEDGRDHLGWHADDSPEMDDARPIAIVTVGAAREIWFRPNAATMSVERMTLEAGSLCIMEPGMQDLWQHRIPKAGFVCGPRISMTFRGFVRS